MALRAGDSRAPYLQIADQLRAAINDGTHAPGDKLPSARELKDQFGVSITTVQNAFNVLSSEGLTYAVPGRGTFVLSDDADPPTHGPSPEYTALRTQIQAVADEVRELRQTVDDLIQSQAPTN